jgi:hypothetical protein
MWPQPIKKANASNKDKSYGRQHVRLSHPEQKQTSLGKEGEDAINIFENDKARQSKRRIKTLL